MATSKELRNPPPRILDNYVVSSQKIFESPESVPDNEFATAGTYAITYASVTGSQYLGYSIKEPIGFDFELNGKVYKEFAVATAGWMMLRDPDGGSTTSNFYLELLDNTLVGSTQPSDNDWIKTSFSYDHVLLAPWFDKNIPIATTPAELRDYYYTNISTSQLSLIQNGLDSRIYPYDAIDRGVRYVNGYDSQKGKYLLVRWTTSQDGYDDRLKFEVALYENGRIEYRYWPVLSYTSDYRNSLLGIPSGSTATVGAYWSGPTFGSNKFRDFAPLLDYNKNERTISPFGGAAYTSTYSETTPSGNSQPYSTNISHVNWPRNGGVITLAPPTKPAKFLPRKIASIISSTKEIVRSPGLFDDRRTINFVSGSITVSMPSTLPSRLLGDSGNVDVSSRQLLFTSGNIEIPGRVNKDSIDTLIEQTDTLNASKKSVDLSFNEFEKNYAATTATTGFYATGSALEIFGDGFLSPLKSKTQFVFSMPVTKQTTMLSSTSSLYYYNVDQQKWLIKDPSNIQDPAKTSLDRSNQEAGITSGRIFRVFENSHGFDAVGRKVVSGTTTPTDNTRFEQSDSNDGAIGAIFNVSPSYGSNDIVDSATSRVYAKSITDASGSYPDSTEIITFNGDYPFLIEKVVIDVPLYISGAWFNDRTTCTRAFGDVGPSEAVPSGAIDFGGPGMTVALMCPRKVGESSYLDLIASGTITSMNDNTASIEFYKNSGMNYYNLRPVGFRAFSTPTTIVSGTGNIFDGRVKLEMTPSVAGGLTISRNDRSYVITSAGGAILNNLIISNREKAVTLLTSPELVTKGEVAYNTYDQSDSSYDSRSPRIYVQQISPLSRGTSKFEFNGNAILGGNVAVFDVPEVIANPLYISSSGSLPSDIKAKIDSSNFKLEAVSIYSLVDSRPAPYLIYPGDKLVVALSKTRPVIYKAIRTSVDGAQNYYGTYQLTGSHGTILFNTGTLNVTLYGSYVREGMEYNP